MLFSEKCYRIGDYLKAHPELDESLNWEYPSETIYTPYSSDAEARLDDFRELCAAMGGFEKTGGNGSGLEAVHKVEEDGEVIFQVCVYVSGVCESRPKLDENGNPVMRKKMKYVEVEEEEVPEMEWDCPQSWLPQS